MSKDAARPAIPEPIKRQVRQRCGFGCVICGMPIYHYDHLVDWSITHRHVADELTLLCPNHHQEKTNKLLPLKTVSSANANPRNRRTNKSPAYPLAFGGPSCEIAIGSNTFRISNEERRGLIPILVNCHAPIHFRMDQNELFFNMEVLDSSGNEVFKIIDNELTYSTNAWDVELKGSELTIRSATSSFVVQILFKPPGRVVVKRCSFHYLNFDVQVTQKELALLRSDGGKFELTGNVATNFEIGILVGPGPPGIGPAPHGLSAAIAFQSGI